MQKSTNLLDIKTSNTAVLVIDKQRGYLEKSPTDGEVVHLQATLPKIDRFIAEARKRKLPIFWTKMLENRMDSPENIQLIIKSDNIKDRTFLDDDSYDIIGLQPTHNETIIEKKYYDAFARTNLKNILDEKSVKNVVVVGAYGSRCVLGTCFGANSNDFNVIALSELIANPDDFLNELELSHNVINSILGWTMNAEDFWKLLKE